MSENIFVSPKAVINNLTHPQSGFVLYNYLTPLTGYCKASPVKIMLWQVYLATYDILLNCDRLFLSYLQCTSFSLKKLCFSSKILVLQAASSEKKTPAAAADWLGELYLILLCAHTLHAIWVIIVPHLTTTIYTIGKIKTAT